jgi:hypothetical protein
MTIQALLEYVRRARDYGRLITLVREPVGADVSRPAGDLVSAGN